MLVLLAERADTRNYTGERPRNWVRHHGSTPPRKQCTPGASWGQYCSARVLL